MFFFLFLILHSYRSEAHQIPKKNTPASLGRIKPTPVRLRGENNLTFTFSWSLQLKDCVHTHTRMTSHREAPKEKKCTNMSSYMRQEKGYIWEPYMEPHLTLRSLLRFYSPHTQIFIAISQFKEIHVYIQLVRNVFLNQRIFA